MQPILLRLLPFEMDEISIQLAKTAKDVKSPEILCTLRNNVFEVYNDVGGYRTHCVDTV